MDNRYRLPRRMLLALSFVYITWRLASAYLPVHFLNMLSSQSLTLLSLVAFTSISASPTGFQQPTICAPGQMGIGHQTDEYSGLYGVIFDSTCTQMDFKSAFDSSMCGHFAFGSEVACKGSAISSAQVSLTGSDLTMYGTCTPAAVKSNCNNTFGLSLNTTISWCCTKS